ncbi:hypothetical protein AS005_04130 [Thermotoga sp. KOL6]|nr:hypothetical protein AS005_04130 [Thermotoga sp. KOL6]
MISKNTSGFFLKKAVPKANNCAPIFFALFSHSLNTLLAFSSIPFSFEAIPTSYTSSSFTSPFSERTSRMNELLPISSIAITFSPH